MYGALTTLIDRLDHPGTSAAGVMSWTAPVPTFGNLQESQVATLGLNPSSREYVDGDGRELLGDERRLHTLSSLGLDSWADVESRHLKLIGRACTEYFARNPYDRWFRRLDGVIAGTGGSYYSEEAAACHVDLVPYATAEKWTDLTAEQRTSLLRSAGDSLGILLRDSPVRLLILNGSAVIKHFQSVADGDWVSLAMPDWSLPRRSGRHVPGYAFRSEVHTVCGVDLGHKVVALGFNHNLQSSFGVTRTVVGAIRRWISEQATEVSRVS